MIATPASRRRARPPNDTGAALDPDGALVVGVHAGEDFHQGALAGAVLAHQRVHFAAVEVEVDVAQRRDAGEGFRDALGNEDNAYPASGRRSFQR